MWSHLPSSTQEIELDESEGMSILVGTLVWDEVSLCAFEEAIESFELAINQVIRHIWNTTDKGPDRCIMSTIRKFKLVEDKDNVNQMVYGKAHLLGESRVFNDTIDLIDFSATSRFCFRLSEHSAIANNMFLLGDVNQKSLFIRECPNINSLWAFMIIEECSRLGLTYFCVAPGSRSSPLAIAASMHPLTTCISCYDERSLAFHAVGYAKGSRKPAVVITSSGTAVSNLLPAVVEASQNFVPLLLLTADRPPELQDVGANQSINQVNHFGSFVRLYSLPTPSDEVPARMVLTTIDSALHLATSTPCGPVHINCPFREPLDSETDQWSLSCLKGLDFWMSNTEPFTRYISANSSFACDGIHGQIVAVVEAIQRANKGLLVIGEIRKEDDIWAAQLLAKHLSWPVIVDILSGLRLRKYFSQAEVENNFYFIDHLDHLLLSDSIRELAHADVIIQIGSRITSKRICQMMEDSFPCTYIFVDEHPFRHDPSHLVTHRIQSTIPEFADCLLEACIPKISSKWFDLLRVLDKVIAWEMSFLIRSEQSLTEPYVSYMIPEAISTDSAIFVGNSMAIRDADMYIRSWVECKSDISVLPSSGLPCFGIQVAGNRGASGIDGLLSTALGFAAGSNKRVICVLGDISFLHDTNGLALLKQRICRKAMTILVLNNHGGAIFSFLPIAEQTEQRLMDQYFYTAHDISLRSLCLAHGLKHVQVRTKLELNNALLASRQEEVDSIIEVESSINANATFHRMLKQFACQAADDALSVLSSFSLTDHMLNSSFFIKISELKYSLYRIQLHAPPTSVSANSNPLTSYRDGFIVVLSLEGGSKGYGEVAPLEFHKENLVDVEEQLRFFIHILKGAKLSYLVPLLKGSLSSWFWNSLGILPASIFPSVRCGLEMAILNAIAARERSSLLDILYRETKADDKLSKRSPSIQICALLDSKGTPKDVADIAEKLAAEGFSAIKVKVARRSDPIEDAMVIREVRERIGPSIKLRADANQKWNYEEAVQFARSVINCDLQYVEEPVNNVGDLIKFCIETGLPVALDETIDNIHENHLEMLNEYTHPGVAAVVIKPSVVGGFENAAMFARWAQQHGKMSVISATFESSLGLSALVQFSCYLDLQNASICRILNREPPPPIAHGLGTYQWLKEDISSQSLKIQRSLYNNFIEASSHDVSRFWGEFEVKNEVILQSYSGEDVHQYQLDVYLEGYSFLANIREIGRDTDDNVVVFLHGFLGTGEEWTSIMRALSQSARCIAVDLPGHGSKIQKDVNYESAEEPSYSIETIAYVMEKLFNGFTPGKVTLVGYSMGARIALYMALRFHTKVKGAVIVSGSPGLRDESARKIRRAKDDSKARSLVSHGLELFLDNWYAGELWKSLRDHPRFSDIFASRLQHHDLLSLAKVLSDSSVGWQPQLWDDLKHCKVPLRLIVGGKDLKFKSIAQKMLQEIQGATNVYDKADICKIVKVPDAGHALHLENPLALIRAISRFLNKSQDK